MAHVNQVNHVNHVNHVNPPSSTGNSVNGEDTLASQGDIVELMLGPGTLGYEIGLHGPDARECAVYRPTHAELKQLVRHWVRIRLEIHDIRGNYELSASEIRRDSYAAGRLAQIGDVIGDIEMRRVTAEVIAEAADGPRNLLRPVTTERMAVLLGRSCGGR